MNQLATAFFAAVLLSGCALVGPDHVPPAPNGGDAFATELRNGLSPRAARPEELAAWWSLLGDPVLTKLIESAARDNHDVRIARSRVIESRAARGAAGAVLFPLIDVSGSAIVSEGAESAGGRRRESYSTGLDAGWEIDLFGGIRRSIEAADAALGSADADARDVLISLVAEVGLNYLELRTFERRLELAEKNVSLQQEALELASFRRQAGLSTELDVDQARYNLEDTRSRLPQLRAGQESAKHRLAVLLGRRPGDLRELSTAAAAPAPLPAEIAVGVPAEALRRRPDVRRAERDLAEATARIGVAAAELYPRLTLGGTIGFQAASTGGLLSSVNRAHSFGPAVSWNVFDAGALRQQVNIQTARQEQAFLRYEQTVLLALEEVENALNGYAEEQERLAALKRATASAEEASRLALQEYSSGLADFREVLEAQRSLFSFEDRLADSRGTVRANLIRLYKALGGGWALALEEEEEV